MWVAGWTKGREESHMKKKLEGPGPCRMKVSAEVWEEFRVALKKCLKNNSPKEEVRSGREMRLRGVVGNRRVGKNSSYFRKARQ